MDWSVDYGDGPRPCAVPHAWRQDVDVRWEGPAVYRASVSVEQPDSWLLFHGVSYRARVFLNDTLVRDHLGIWDAFAVPLPTGNVDVQVEVVKNGGASFPVKDVMSGFLPYVFNTFGGIYREVEVVVSKSDPLDNSGLSDTPRQLISVDGTKLFINGNPWYMRGVLSWGWYPDIGHPNPPIDVIRDEVRKVKALGFNLVKFCLWVPPHSYFQVLEEEGMWAWMELPLWMPSPTMDLEAAFDECRRIVSQYRHHDRIVCWTCGCELSESTPHEYRKRLFDIVTELTGCPLVKDNSGGSEMYGGDLREYGTFYDFHPYCDTQFYPVVLDSLMIGPRKRMPVLLGEFNDYDVYRPLGPLRGQDSVASLPEFPWVLVGDKSDPSDLSVRSDSSDIPRRPYWASSDPRLNDKGVRWQYDLPGVLSESVDWPSDEAELDLVQSSLTRSILIRQFVTRSVAALDDIAGYVVTGLADTPISTSSVQAGSLNKRHFVDPTYFAIPFRGPPWVNGGNRPGWSDPVNHFSGTNTIRFGGRLTNGGHRSIRIPFGFEPRLSATFDVLFEANRSQEIGAITSNWGARHDFLSITDGSLDTQHFSLAFYDTFSVEDLVDWQIHDPARLLPFEPKTSGAFQIRTEWNEGYAPGVQFLNCLGSVAKPFWRECVAINDTGVEFFDHFEHLLPIATDRVLDPVWLESELPGAEWLLTRVDTRTYARHPYVARKGKTVVTTLRPWGGLGAQPYGLDNNPAGCELLRVLMRLAEEG